MIEEKLLRYSRIPIMTALTHAFATFDRNDYTERAYQAAWAMATGQREHWFLTIGGEPGRGKTHLAFAIGWLWLRDGRGIVRYYHVAELLDMIRSEYDNPPRTEHGSPMRSQIDHAQGADLLILDDLGAEKGTEWAAEKLDMIIDHRYINGMATVITTNKTTKELSARIASRMREGVMVAIKGPDFREEKARRRRQGEGVKNA